MPAQDFTPQPIGHNNGIQVAPRTWSDLDDDQRRFLTLYTSNATYKKLVDLLVSTQRRPECIQICNLTMDLMTAQ